jgi:hypothetical protein
MVVENPAALPTALKKLLDNAGQQALSEPTKIGQLFDQFPKPGDPPPTNPLTTLPAFQPVQWWSLLVFMLVKIQDGIGDPELWVAVQQAPQWARMVTLNYSPGAKQNSPPPPPVLTVGLALGDSQNGTLKQGIWINLVDDIDNQSGSTPLGLTLSGHGSGSWSYEFSGELSPPTGAADSWVQATLEWAPDWPLPAIPLVNLTTPGPVTAGVKLASTPLYQVDLGIRSLGAELKLGNSVLATLASSVLHVDPIQYSPRVELVKDHPPTFTLGS